MSFLSYPANGAYKLSRYKPTLRRPSVWVAGCVEIAGHNIDDNLTKFCASFAYGRTLL